MEHLAQGPDWDLWLETPSRPFQFHSPCLGREFVLMLVVNDVTITEAERAALSVEIVRQGCRYAVCAGHDCSAWDDAIDLAFLRTDPNSNPPDDRFVMTTWHDDEPLEDIVLFFRWCTTFDDFIPENFVVMILGNGDLTEEETRRALTQYF